VTSAARFQRVPPRSLGSGERSVPLLARLFGLPALAGYGRIKGVTLIHLPDFVCCHLHMAIQNAWLDYLSTGRASVAVTPGAAGDALLE
jgi:hypothetical protein